VKVINATSQLEAIERISKLVERAKKELGDADCLDILDGPEGQNLSELQERLIDASACLRALRKQLKARVETAS
jgi:hypothetical protein